MQKEQGSAGGSPEVFGVPPNTFLKRLDLRLPLFRSQTLPQLRGGGARRSGSQWVAVILFTRSQKRASVLECGSVLPFVLSYTETA